MKKCQKLLECEFFQKFPKHAGSYKYVYCEGAKLESCARLSYKKIHGESPPDGLTPTGLLIELDEEAAP